MSENTRFQNSFGLLREQFDTVKYFNRLTSCKMMFDTHPLESITP